MDKPCYWPCVYGQALLLALCVWTILATSFVCMDKSFYGLIIWQVVFRATISEAGFDKCILGDSYFLNYILKTSNTCVLVPFVLLFTKMSLFFSFGQFMDGVSD